MGTELVSGKGMEQPDHYRTLGLPSGATTSQIKARYRALAKQHHPDNNGNTGKMVRINKAYAVLSDPKSRFKYDQSQRSALVKRTNMSTKPATSAAPICSAPTAYAQHVGPDYQTSKRHFPRMAFGAFGVITVLLILAFAIPHLHLTPQSIHTANTSSMQSSTGSSNKFPSTTIADNGALSKKLQQEEAKIQQEQALEQKYEKQAQQYATQSQLDYQSAQDLGDTSTLGNTPSYASPVTAPDSGPFPLTSSSGDLDGTYYYAVSFVSTSGTETSLSSASLSVSPHNQEVWVTDIPTSSNSSVTERKLYRTKASGSMVGPYYMVATFNDETTTSYYDNTPDSALPAWTIKY